ncbi:MAG: hypothetical protein ACF8XB_08455, partial [Planctomycetota bacterium JB042]
LAEGARPDTAVYEADYVLEPGEYTALRLEALTHDSLPHRGPGRADNGNFVLSEVTATVSQRGSVARPREVVLTECHVDHSEPTLSGGYAVDGRVVPDQGWSADGHRRHEDRTAVLLPARPFGFNNGSTLKVRLSFESQWPAHAVGRFRVSVTRADPATLIPRTAEIDPAAVDAATRRGIAYLLDRQEPDGTWVGMDRVHYYGMTALAVYTLVQAGVRKDHPAIRAGIAAMESRPCHRTYDRGVTLLAYRAIGEPLPKRRIAELTRGLIDTVGNGSTAQGNRWGYPYGHTPTSDPNHVDLSNTQYALLGLRAGVKCGERVPSIVWDRVAKELLESQGDYGSFSYQPGRNPTASMTVAGVACLWICAEQLEEARKTGLARRCRAGAELGAAWLDRNWSVAENVQVPRDTTGGANRWYFYYLHGLERIGALANRRLLAGHDWYAEGAAEILARQKDDGSWGTAYGENDTNTCFALLFLQRGTSSTGRDERPPAFDAAEAGGAFAVATNGEDPLVAWVRDLGAPVKERLARGEVVRVVEWSIDGEVVAAARPNEGLEASLQRFPLQTELESNGELRLAAEMHFDDAAGAPAGSETSAEVRVTVDSVEEPFHRAAIADAAVEGIDPAATQVEVSSAFDGNWPAEHAIDGRAGTAWLSDAHDDEPWIRLRFRRPLAAGVLKLVPAHPYLGGDADWARPREVEIRVNNGKPLAATLFDDVTVKQAVTFEATRVRSLRIAVKSVYPGTVHRIATGFAAIELLPSDHPLEVARRGFARPVTFVLPDDPGGSVEWRYVLEAPAGDWTSPDFDDRRWRKGIAPFRDAVSREERRTATEWGTADVWLRTELRVDDPTRGGLVFQVKVDDRAELYVNGVLAGQVDVWTKGRYRSIAPNAAGRAALVPGSNLIAVKATDIGGKNFFDLQVVRTEPD